MTTATGRPPMMERIAGAPPRLTARIAGGLYLSSFLTAAFTELFARGSLNFAGGLVAVLGMVVVTLLLYDIFKPVNRSSLCSRRSSASWGSPSRFFDCNLAA